MTKTIKIREVEILEDKQIAPFKIEYKCMECKKSGNFKHNARWVKDCEGNHAYIFDYIDEEIECEFKCLHGHPSIYFTKIYYHGKLVVDDRDPEDDWGV